MNLKYLNLNNIFVKIKFSKPSIKNCLSKIFDTPKHLWSFIYYIKITKMHDKEIPELL